MTIKKQSARILAAFLLLMTFATGQLIVIAHNHSKEAYASHQSKKSGNDDECKICAQNGHLPLYCYSQQSNLFALAVTAVNCYREYQQSFYSVQLQQASNRGPPLG